MAVPNYIGGFSIGESQIGDLPAFDYMVTVISQYSNSPILLQLIDNFNQCVDLTKLSETFYDVIFNVATAQGYGLDVWGRIVGVSRVLNVPTEVTLGFEEAGAGTSSVGFNQGSFFSTGVSFTSNYALSDAAFRVLIYAKALSNISDCSITSINQLLLNLFPNRGDIHVVDNLNMTMTINVGFSTTVAEKVIIQGSGALPRPTGVLCLYNFA